MKRHRLVVSAFVSAAFSTLPVAAFGGGVEPYDEARQAVAAAQRLEQAGQWSAATALLTDQIGRCVGTDAEPCRLFLMFSLGYLAERQAAIPGANAQQMLAEAARYYESILRTAPDHNATVVNLAGVYIRQGQRARARQLLGQALQAGSEPGSRLAVLLGDLEREDGRWAEALAVYRQATEQSVDTELPRRRIVELYEDAPVARLSELSSLLEEWRARFPGVTELGYRQIMARTFVSDPRMAEQHLLRWVELGARARWISVPALERLPSGWATAARSDLRRYLEAPDRRPSPSWWMDRPERRHTLAQVALALGAERSAAADPSGAEARWQTAIQFAPEYDEYVYGSLQNQRVVRLDLETELVSLYSQYPQLDSNGTKFRTLLNSLFAGKARAYDVRDLETIQRHHMILGAIYAERGTWRSSPDYMNGIFQLEHALSVAKQIERNSGFYQPLPDIYARLATGYLAVGQSDKARTARLQAALAYLDTDQVERAQEMLGVAWQQMAQAPVSERALHAGLAQVVETRRLIGTGARETFDPTRAGYVFHEGGAHSWLFGNPVSGLFPDFVARQQFKALCDLGLKTSGLGYPRAGKEYGQRAFITATDHVKSLAGAGDLVRIEKLKVAVSERAILRPTSPRIDLKAPAPSAPGKAFSLALSTDTRPLYVQVSPDAVLAARLGETIRTDPQLRDMAVQFTVTGGRVIVRETPTAMIPKEAYDRLRSVTGVRDLVVQPAPAGRGAQSPAPSPAPVPAPSSPSSLQIH